MNEELDLPKVNRYRYKKQLVEPPVSKKTSGRPKTKNRLLTHSVLDDHTTISVPEIPKYGNTKYDPSMCNKLIEIMADGKFEASACVAIGISKQTFWKYIEKYPEFCAAYEMAKTANEAIHEDTIVGMGKGTVKGNVVAQLGVLNNKYKWTQKPGSESANTTNNINILVQNQSREQIIQSIQEYIARSPELLAIQEPNKDIEHEIEIVDEL
jgi:hypothetical protein